MITVAEVMTALRIRNARRSTPAGTFVCSSVRLWVEKLFYLEHSEISYFTPVRSGKCR